MRIYSGAVCPSTSTSELGDIGGSMWRHGKNLLSGGADVTMARFEAWVKSEHSCFSHKLSVEEEWNLGSVQLSADEGSSSVELGEIDLRCTAQIRAEYSSEKASEKMQLFLHKVSPSGKSRWICRNWFRQRVSAEFRLLLLRAVVRTTPIKLKKMRIGSGN